MNEGFSLAHDDGSNGPERIIQSPDSRHRTPLVYTLDAIYIYQVGGGGWLVCGRYRG